MHEEFNRRDGSSHESESADPDFELLLGSLDAASLRSLRTGECPPIEDLMRAADRSMDASGRAVVEAHTEQCPACACLMTQISRVSAPIARFHESSIVAMAWNHLRSGGRLDRPLEEAWARHRRHCESCERRARLLTRIGARREQAGVPARRSGLQRLVPAGAFGLGVVLTVLVMSRLGPSPHPDAPGHGVESGTVERSLPAMIPDSSTEGILDLMLRPTPSRLESTLESWDCLHPDLKMQKSVALGGICLQEADAEQDADRKALWLTRSETELMAGRAELDRKLSAVRRSLSALPDSVRHRRSDVLPTAGKE